MRKYFYLRDKQKFGPLTLEELKKHKITADTKVWFEGMAQWMQAKDIPELSGIIKLKVPPKPKVQAAGSKPKAFDFSKITSWFTITLPGMFKKIKLPDYRNKYFIIGSAATLLIIVALILVFTLKGSEGEPGNSGNNDVEAAEVNDAEEPGKTNSQKTYSAEALKVRNNYKEYLPVNITYAVMGRRGGVKQVMVTVKNNTSFNVQHLTVAIEYLSSRNKVVDTEYIQFSNLQPGANPVKSAPDFKRCETARAVLNKLKIPSINLYVYPKVEK